jgi:hypothetical protein
VVESTEEAGSGPERILFFPDLLVREISQALAAVAVVVLLGAFVGAPVGDRANPGMSPNPAKSPWYFMGVQELLIHLHPTFAVLIVPGLALLAFVAFPLFGRDDGPAGRWFLTARGRRLALAAAGTAIAATAVLVVADELLGSSGVLPGGWIVRGLVPVAVLGLVLPACAARLVRGPDGVSRDEAIQTLVVFLCASFATLTVIGIFFRGEGMALGLPWSG